MKLETMERGGLTVRAWGTPGAPAVMLCHGYGAPADDLIPLAEVLDPEGARRWFFPAAPLALGAMGIPGRAWWNIDMAKLQRRFMASEVEAVVREVPPGFVAASEALSACIDALAAEGALDPAKLVLGGFSQGAMVATDVALHRKDKLAGLALLSGSLMGVDRWETRLAEAAPQLVVFQSHGRADPVLPFALAEVLRDSLLECGAMVGFVPFEGGHEIPPPALRGLLSFLQQRLG